jgi:hypothetical protein
MIGDIYKLPVHDDREGWITRCLLVLDTYEALPYNKNYLAASCLILETGEDIKVYVDTLQSSGEKIA